MALVGSLSGSGGASNTINVTGSIIIANPGTGGLFPAFPGTDAVFFVSGAIDGKAAGSRTVAVFGGDVVASGSITVGTGSITIDSNEIRFLGGAAKITSSSAGLTFFDSNNTGGKSLTELAAGGGGGGGAGVFTEASATAAFTTSSIAIGIAAAASTIGSDVFFFVSGSTDGTKNAHFGGDVVTSGSITVRDAASNLAITGDGFGYSYITAAGSYLNLDANNRIIVKKDLEVQGTNIFAGGSGAARGIFTDNVTQANLITIGGVGGKTTVAGELEVTSNFISGSAGLNLTLGSGGDVTVAGDLTVTGNDIKSSTGATAITLSGGNVIIPGDLTVQGTTVTVDATTLTIEDPVIGLGFTSGSTATTAGDRGFIGGISGGDNVALIWDNTDSTFTSARTSTGAGNDPVAITSYTPFRASSFQVGGTPGSAVAAGSAYLSSSDALNVLVNHTATTTFTKAGTPIVQVGDYAGSGEGQIKGVTTANALSALWLSGSEINVGATSVAFLVNDVQQATITPLASGGGVRFEGQDGTGTPRAMVVSGSQTTIGSNNRLVVFEGAGVPFLTASVGGGTVSLTAGAGVGTASVFNTVSTTVNFAQSAATINMGNPAGTNNVAGVTKFTQGLSGSLTRLTDGTSYLIAGTNVTIATGSSGAVTISSTGTTNAAGSDTQVQFNDGGTAFGADADFTFTKGTNTLAVPNASVTAVTASSVIAGGATVDLFNTTATTVNFAQAATTITAGASGGSTTFQGNLTGSNILANAGLTVTQGASFGGGFGNTGVTITGGGNISADGTLLIVGATTLSGSVILGDATGDDLTFNGYAASNLVPKTTNSFDLGAPDLRWRNMYTGDLHLKNERGDWTVIEEEEFLTLTNNKNGKRYKFVLEEI